MNTICIIIYLYLILGSPYAIGSGMLPDPSPKEKEEIFAHALEARKKFKIPFLAKRTGQKMRRFSLPNAYGKIVHSEELLKDGCLIITFYRGSWCPFCVSHLKTFSQYVEVWKNLGAQVVAISSEPAHFSKKLKEEQGIPFDLLNDEDNRYTKKIGLVFPFDPKEKEFYQKKIGLDLGRSRNNKKWEVPVTSTYVLSRKGIILFTHVEENYRIRTNPEDITSILKKNLNTQSQSSMPLCE